MESPQRIGVIGWFLRAFAAGFGVVFGVGSAVTLGLVFYLLLAAAGSTMLSTDQSIDIDLSGNRRTRSLDSLTESQPSNSFPLAPSPIAPAQWQDTSGSSYPSGNPYANNAPSRPVGVAPYDSQPAMAAPAAIAYEPSPSLAPPGSPAIASPATLEPVPTGAGEEQEAALPPQPIELEPPAATDEAETSEPPAEEDRLEAEPPSLPTT